MEARPIAEVLAKAKPRRSAHVVLARIENAKRDPNANLLFLVPGLAQCGFPHTRQVQNIWVRRNGKCQMTLCSSPEVGLPYGVLARLLMMYFTRLVSRNKSPVIELERITEFMRFMDIDATGGKNGSIRRVRHQTEALLRTMIEIKIQDNDRYSIKNTSIFSDGEVWSDGRRGYLKMSDAMFAAVVKSSVPYVLEIIGALKCSPLTLDLYCWAKWRANVLLKRNPYGKVDVSYAELNGPNGQCGAMYEGYKQRSDIRASFVRHVSDSVRRINAADPKLLLSITAKGISLRAIAVLTGKPAHE